MKRLILGAAAALVLTTGITAQQAAAEGLPPTTSRIRGPEPAGPDWNGFYAGLGIGAGAAVYDVSGAKEKKCWKIHGCWVCEEEKPFGGDDTSDIGVFGTVTVGYDRVIRPGWVGGVFADYDFGSSISSDFSISLGRRHSFDASLDHNYSWAVGVRLGKLVTPSTLVYGTGGYTQADFDVGNSGSTTFAGYFVGAGVETFLRENWTLKLEYRFAQFGSETVADTYHLNAEIEPSLHTARVVLSYKFGYGH